MIEGGLVPPWLPVALATRQRRPQVAQSWPTPRRPQVAQSRWRRDNARRRRSVSPARAPLPGGNSSQKSIFTKAEGGSSRGQRDLFVKIPLLRPEGLKKSPRRTRPRIQPGAKASQERQTGAGTQEVAGQCKRARTAQRAGRRGATRPAADSGTPDSPAGRPSGFVGRFYGHSARTHPSDRKKRSTGRFFACNLCGVGVH